LEGDDDGTPDVGELVREEGLGVEGMGVMVDPVGPGVLYVGDWVILEGDDVGCGLGGTGLV
jgi:hypothetical protein